MNWNRGLFRAWLGFSVLWSLAVGGLCWKDLQGGGPPGRGLVTSTVVSKTRENASVLEGNAFRDLVPVEQVIEWRPLLLALSGPPLLTFLVGYALLWITRGFRS